MTGVRGVLGRTLLVLLGIGVIALLLREAGTTRVAAVLWSAGRWLPIILSLELIQLGSDFFALRFILGAGWREVPAATWMRSSALAYGMTIVFPAGRAAGEVARATLLSKHLGAPRAAAASTQLQSAYVFANGLASAIDCAVVATWLGARSPLALLLAGNALIMAAAAAALLAILWNARLGAWLDRQRRRFMHVPADPPPQSAQNRRPVPYVAAAICSMGRGAQVLQYGVILRAVGGVVSARGAFVAHGIHIIGTTVGDLIPGQLGVVDGAYRTFAAAIGFGGAPARALSLAFLARIAQLIVAGACVLVVGLARHAASRDRPSSAAVDARAHS